MGTWEPQKFKEGEGRSFERNLNQKVSLLRVKRPQRGLGEMGRRLSKQPRWPSLEGRKEIAE